MKNSTRPTLPATPKGVRPRGEHPAGRGLVRPVVALRAQAKPPLGGERPPRPVPVIASTESPAQERTPVAKHGPALIARLRRDERGAVTAEYAIIIMAGVAFAGLLVAIIRSPEIRAMLVSLVEKALGSSG